MKKLDIYIQRCIIIHPLKIPVWSSAMCKEKSLDGTPSHNKVSPTANKSIKRQDLMNEAAKKIARRVGHHVLINTSGLEKKH